MEHTKAYKGMESAVVFEGNISEYFPVLQSVRQGGVLSPWLYLIYINDLLRQLRFSGLGAQVGPHYCGSVAQADDVAVITLSPRSMQIMLDICYTYSCKWCSLSKALVFL